MDRPAVTLEHMPRRLAQLELAQALQGLHWLIQHAPDSSLTLDLHSEDLASPTRRMQLEMKASGWAKIRILNARGKVEVALYYQRTPQGRWQETRVVFGGDP